VESTKPEVDPRVFASSIIHKLSGSENQYSPEREHIVNAQPNGNWKEKEEFANEQNGGEIHVFLPLPNKGTEGFDPSVFRSQIKKELY
jgi:hypothetical protein